MISDNDRTVAAGKGNISLWQWIQSNWQGIAAGIVLVAVYLFYFGFLKIFYNGQQSTWTWAWNAWNPENNYEHAKLIPFIVVFLVWHSRDKLKAAPVGSSNWGWLFIAVGLFLYVAGARTLQGRVTMVALPFLLYGSVLFIWGRSL